MEQFINGVMIRWLSGIKNGQFYKGHLYTAYLFCVLVIAALVYYAIQLNNGWSLAFALPVTITIFYIRLFYKEHKLGSKNIKFKSEIHAYENALQYSWMLFAILAGVDIIGLVASALLGNALFNMPIQHSKNGRYINRRMGKYDKYSLRAIVGLDNGYVVTAIGIAAGIAYYYIHCIKDFNLSIYGTF